MSGLKRKIQRLNGWGLISLLILILFLLPIVTIIGSAFTPASDKWAHIVEYLLRDYILNTYGIVFSTSILAIVLGLSLAWTISAFEFPLRKFFKLGLILPLAIPPYIGAYTYNGLLSYTGPIQTFLRANFNFTPEQKYFDIMTAKGAVFIFTLFLFPYVYLITGSFLEKQSASLFESARMLGRGTVAIFFRVILPLSRISLIGGGSLVALEVLNDYGVVKYFGIPTFSTAIFTTWFGLGDTDSALKLSVLLMVFVLFILLVERVARGRKRYHYATAKIRPMQRIRLSGFKAFLAVFLCSMIFSLSFFIPLLQLFYWGFLSADKIQLFKLIGMVSNSFVTTSVASLVVVTTAVVLGNFSRLNTGVGAKILTKIVSLGYSIPGAVIAMGVITLFVLLDKKVSAINHFLSKDLSENLLSGSIFMLIFAYFIRFLSIGTNSVEAGLEKIGKKFHEASRTMGNGITRTFFKVDLPMMKPAILGAFILVFIDIMKELPLTLILRPFNYNTLSTKTFEYASDEMIHEASVSSLIIIGLCLAALILFNRISNRRSTNVH